MGADPSPKTLSAYRKAHFPSLSDSKQTTHSFVIHAFYNSYNRFKDPKQEISFEIYYTISSFIVESSRAPSPLAMIQNSAQPCCGPSFLSRPFLSRWLQARSPASVLSIFHLIGGTTRLRSMQQSNYGSNRAARHKSIQF